jgi:hypothetical protein
VGKQWDAIEAHLDALVRPSAEFGLDLQAERIRTVMRAFYAYLVFLAFPWTSAASSAWTSGTGARAKVGLGVAALVPLSHWDSVQVVGCAILLLGSVLLCLDPRWRLARICVALAFVFVTALQFDAKGKVDHGNHLAMWTAIGFCFLSPDRRGSAAQRSFVASFFGVQVLIGTLYSCAGICKIIGMFYDGPDGLTWFHPEALPCMITGNWDRSRETLLGGFFVVHPALSVPGQAAAFVLELGALPAVFFRHLQRPWAIGLIALHAMILHTMKIHFHQSCFILVLVLVASPFAPSLRSTFEWLASRVTGWNERRAVGSASKRSEAIGGEGAEPAESVGKKGRLDRSFGARWPRLWGPILAAVYLAVAFSRFEPSEGAFRQELYPVSPMAMFFRVHPSPEKLDAVQRLRTRLLRDGLFPERRAHDEPKKKSKKRAH